MRVNITNFMNVAHFMRLINAGQSNLSDHQDKIAKDAYKDAFDLLEKCSVNRDATGFERVCWAVNMLKPSKSTKEVIKHPEMYEKMISAQSEFKSKIAEKCKISNPFNLYWQQYGPNVR